MGGRKALLVPITVPPPRAGAPMERVGGAKRRFGHNTLAVVKVDGLPEVLVLRHHVRARIAPAFGRRRRGRGSRRRVGGDLFPERLEIGGSCSRRVRRRGGGRGGDVEFAKTANGRRGPRRARRRRRLRRCLRRRLRLSRLWRRAAAGLRWSRIHGRGAHGLCRSRLRRRLVGDERRAGVGSAWLSFPVAGAGPGADDAL